jgi:hypothetical protein
MDSSVFNHNHNVIDFAFEETQNITIVKYSDIVIIYCFFYDANNFYCLLYYRYKN